MKQFEIGFSMYFWQSSRYLIFALLCTFIPASNSFYSKPFTKYASTKGIQQDFRLRTSKDDSILFKFGVVADIQYADAPDALNFQKTKTRRYRQSLSIYREAIENWKENNVSFSVVLGDIIDAQTVLDNSRDMCLQRVICEGKVGASTPYYCFGNHCHYCFPRTRLRQELLDPVAHTFSVDGIFPSNNEYPEQLFYHWSPFPGYRFISLDSYEVSLIGAANDQYRKLAKAWISEHNPNDLSLGDTWFQGLPREKYRWVPYNGGLSENQLHWLRRVLQASSAQQEKVIIFSHQPVYAPHRPTSLIWNAEEVLDILWEYEDLVLLWMAGHDHGGQHHVDHKGITHLVPPAPIECEIGEKAFGYFEVHSDRLQLQWYGKTPCSSTFQPWPKQIPYRRTQQQAAVH